MYSLCQRHYKLPEFRTHNPLRGLPVVDRTRLVHGERLRGCQEAPFIDGPGEHLKHCPIGSRVQCAAYSLRWTCTQQGMYEKRGRTWNRYQRMALRITILSITRALASVAHGTKPRSRQDIASVSRDMS